VVVAGSSSYRALRSPSLISSAQAADAVAPTSGFADLVAKVKPAVISVRVRIERSTGTNGIGQSEGNNPFPLGSPMERFFQQFGPGRV
jgi:serine protease Do